MSKNCKNSGFKDFFNTTLNKCIINTNNYHNTSMCASEINKNSKSIIGDSVVKCDKTIGAVARSYNSTNFNEKEISCKIGNFICLVFITISLLIILSIYYFYYHIRYCSKQKHTLPYYHSNNKLKEIDVNNII